jgi:hypothetical protein
MKKLKEELAGKKIKLHQQTSRVRRRCNWFIRLKDCKIIPIRNRRPGTTAWGGQMN